MFDSIANAVSGSPWTYLLIVGVCTFDALLPLLPSETVVVTAAVLGSRGRLNVELVAVCAAAGALLGDNSAYWAGRNGLRRLVDRTMRSEKSQRRLEWAGDQLKERGGWIIIVARFIPGGRTATTYVAGTSRCPGIPSSSRSTRSPRSPGRFSRQGWATSAAPRSSTTCGFRS